MSSSDDGVHGREPSMPMPRAMRPSRVLRGALAPREGQSLTEFALVLPIFMVLVMAIIYFGIAFENKISMDNAARSGARFAAVYTGPSRFSIADPAAGSTINGRIQADGSTVHISNPSGIQIQYYAVDSNTGATTECGKFTSTYNSTLSTYYVAENGYSSTSPGTDCVLFGNEVKVTVSATFKLPIPIISAFFPTGINITSSSTMMIDYGWN